MPSPAAPQLCSRCRQPLPEGSGYCVACGCTNEFATQSRQASLNQQADNRIEAAGFWRKIFQFLRIMR